jgi:hypothetical protein
VHQPALAIAGFERTPQPGGGSRVLVRVTAVLPEDPIARAVRHATVEIGGASALTDHYGWAIVDVPERAPLEVHATAGGFVGITAPLD